MLGRTLAVRLSILGFALFFGCLLLVLVVGTEANGAVRWLSIAGFQLQPIEFLKPCFVVVTALLLSARFEDPTLPVLPLSAAMLVPILALLAKQPDIGQAALITAVWVAQACLAGMSIWVVGATVAGGLGAIVVAYQFEPHVQKRIDGFLFGEGDTYQVDSALNCFRAGGLFGAGPGEGQMKFRLPEPHTDYIFSVIGEEFGALACIAIGLLFLTIVVRVLVQLLDEEDPFVLLAAVGLVTQFGAQAAINMSVNVALMPSKGMTLPFISHGGSSFLALALGMGLLLALTRTNRHLKNSPYLKARPA
jgi:cell division protein FtsW